MFFARWSTIMFQFTLPRGERQGLRFDSATLIPSFNSRSREGSDLFHLSSFCFTMEFQFTLPRGERRERRRLRGQSEGVSIHAPARGATAVSLSLEGE